VTPFLSVVRRLATVTLPHILINGVPGRRLAFTNPVTIYLLLNDIVYVMLRPVI
jgi:hypothetical protein